MYFSTYPVVSIVGSNIAALLVFLSLSLNIVVAQ